MLMWEGRPMLPEAVRGNREDQRGSVSTGSELEFENGGENGHACRDREWVKMMIAIAGIVSDGTVHSRDSQGWAWGLPEIV
jgi:hypothetical protein